MQKFYVLIISILLLYSPCTTKAKEKKQAEVIHWWVSGGEAAALQVAVDEFQRLGNVWIDTPVKNSYHAKTAAISRLLSGNPPTVVQWHVGVRIKDLYQEKLLHDVNQLASAEGWQKVLPKVIWDYIVVDGQVVVVPVTLHGSNWIWANPKVLKAAGVGMPNSWQEFIKAASAIQKAGYTPLALGGQPWQINLLFLNVALSVGGADFYRAALVNRDLNALGGPKMVKTFEAFSQLRTFVDSKNPGRGWSETTNLVIQGKAAFQTMGDWAKGEFIQAGMTAGKDFQCALFPGTANNYIVVSDAFAMVAVKDKKAIEAQQELARILMDPKVQRRFNLLKGSIPPRTDVSMDGFDQCARLAMQQTRKPDSVIPGINMAYPEIIASAILDTVSSFWNTPTASSSEAAKSLAQAVQEASF
ncbi:MAG: carbohydrate ABC transporter substrate-binding protein [SAR324 cluster bacterium]|nr:carbohydrate ABC transporter substrate-binding protein [SAR324 cluster bacterium]